MKRHLWMHVALVAVLVVVLSLRALGVGLPIGVLPLVLLACPLMMVAMVVMMVGMDHRAGGVDESASERIGSPHHPEHVD